MSLYEAIWRWYNGVAWEESAGIVVTLSLKGPSYIRKRVCGKGLAGGNVMVRRRSDETVEVGISVASGAVITFNEAVASIDILGLGRFRGKFTLYKGSPRELTLGPGEVLPLGFVLPPGDDDEPQND